MRHDWRTPVAVILTLVLGFALVPGAADARPQDGVKEGSGYRMPTRNHPEHWYGAQQLGEVTAYCIDLNSGPPREASAWTEYSNYTLFKQTGWGGPRGKHGDGPNKTLVGQLAALSWILHETGPSPTPDVAAAVEHAVRVRTVDGSRQVSKEAQRWAAVTAAHPGALSEFNRLQQEAAHFAGPYTIDIIWDRRPDAADPTGEFRVSVLSASGRPVPYRPLTLTTGGDLAIRSADASTGSDGIARVRIELAKPFDEAVTGRVAAKVSGVPGALPRLFVPVEKTIQRMIAAPEPVALDWEYEVTLEPVPWTPEVTTRTRDVIARPGAPAVDVITLSGGKPGGTFTGSTTLHGPFATLAELAAADPRTAPVVGAAAFSGTWDDDGAAEVHSSALEFGAPGYYTWRERLEPSPLVEPPPPPKWPQQSETSVVVAPAVASELQTSGDHEPGVRVTDTLELTGVPRSLEVPGSQAPLEVLASGELLGPVAPQQVNGLPVCEQLKWHDAPVVARYEDEPLAGTTLAGLLPSVLDAPGCYTAAAKVTLRHEGRVVAEFVHPPGIPAQSIHVLAPREKTPPPIPPTPPPPAEPPTPSPPVTTEPPTPSPPATTPPSAPPAGRPTPPPTVQPPPTGDAPPKPSTPRINSGEPIGEVSWDLVHAGLLLAFASVVVGAWARSTRT